MKSVAVVAAVAVAASIGGSARGTPAERACPASVPPSAGCWKLSLTTGRLHNTLVARVDG